MSRIAVTDSIKLAVAVGLLVLPALAMPTKAEADVLEVGVSGASWVAGGPAALPAAAALVLQEPIPGLETNAPMTAPAESAGPAQWRGRVAELAVKYDVSPQLLEALVWQESRWRTNALSPVGARGLAQLMPGTARQMGVNPHDPSANLEGGARYLRMQLDAFGGDLEKALAAYNAGPARVAKANGIPRIRETQNYVASIMARLSDPVRR